MIKKLKTLRLAVILTVLVAICFLAVWGCENGEPSPSGTWVPQGPGPTLGGEVTLPQQSNPVAGAVKVVLAHPEDVNILYIGTVNGGIWRTKNATDPAPDPSGHL